MVVSLVKSDFFLNSLMSKPVRHLYEFGQFQLDVQNSQLLRDGEVVALKPKVFDTLLLLVENSGTLLSKEELMQRLWPETSVEENNLTQNISILRKALDDNNQIYIKTAPKRGYCFVAEVREIGDEEETFIIQRHTSSHVIIEQEEDETSPEYSPTIDALPLITSAPSKLRQRITISVVVALLLAITGMIWWELSRSKIWFEPSDFRFTQLADWKAEPGEAGTQAVLSPDGKMIAYERVKNGQSNIWVQMVSGSDPSPVTKDVWNNYHPVWSPDSRELAFFSIRGKPGIYRVPFLGGSPLLIKEIESGCKRLVEWSDERIYYESKNNLFALDLASNDIIQITDFPAEPYITIFKLSPDRTQILYVQIGREEKKTFIRDLSDGTTIQLADNEDLMNPIWLPDSSGILYSSRRNDFYQICVTYLSGETRQLTSGDTDFNVSDISSDAKTIFYSSSVEEADLWCASVDERKDEHLTFNIKVELWPAVSPDSSLVAFQQTDKLWKFFDCSIFLIPRDNSSDPRLIIKDGFDAKWSPDGSKIAFLRTTNKLLTLWIAASSGSNERQISNDEIMIYGFGGMPHNRSQIRNYVWSPDGKSLAYVSKKLGYWNLRRFSLDDWIESDITNYADTNTYILSPLWSSDGQRLAYVSRKVMSSGQSEYSIQVVEGLSQEVIFKADADIRLLGWEQSGSELIIAMEKPSQKGGNIATRPQTVNIFRVASAKKREIAELKETYYRNIQLSPDRRTIAFASRQDGKDNIWVLLGNTQKKITDNTDPNIYFSSLEWSPDQRMIYYSRQHRKSQISLIEIVR